MTRRLLVGPLAIEAHEWAAARDGAVSSVAMHSTVGGCSMTLLTTQTATFVVLRAVALFRDVGEKVVSIALLV